MIRLFTLLALTVTSLGTVVPAHANTPSIQYPGGWNMAGGPSGTSLGTAQALYVYHGGQYTTPSGSSTAGCQGYWAYFSRPTGVTLASSSATGWPCSLEAGWNLVGDPFDAPASVPSGLTVYRWDTSASRYVTSSLIPSGGAVWIYADSSRSITLQPATSSGGISITFPPAAQQIQLHVGQTLTLTLAGSGSGASFVPSVDAAYLQPVSAGPVPGTSTYSYTWLAIAAGNTVLTLNPACLANGCKLPSAALEVHILP